MRIDWITEIETLVEEADQIGRLTEQLVSVAPNYSNPVKRLSDQIMRAVGRLEQHLRILVIQLPSPQQAVVRKRKR